MQADPIQVVKVLYDYEAEEENEMSLMEGEVIEQIEQIDEGIFVFFLRLVSIDIDESQGWWSGVGAGLDAL